MCNMLIVTGTRPEIIKMAPIYKYFKEQNVHIDWCHTGQHDSLADQTFHFFSIAPTYVLERPIGATLSDLVGGLMKSVESILQSKKYQCVLVHGDTSSTLAGALAAFYNQVPIIGHVEAGLRSGNLQHPFPEESNRTLVGKIANLHFAPTDLAKESLLKEGVDAATILVTGNTAIDAQNYLIESGVLKVEVSNTVLVTAHRRENWEYIPTICQAIKTLAQCKPDLHFLFASHPNPKVKQSVLDNLVDCDFVNVVEPLDYIELQQVLLSAPLVLTDSGGIQEEAPTYGTRVVVLRETTERPEALALGLSVLSGATDESRIVESAISMLEMGKASNVVNPYGDGQASKLILNKIRQVFND
ncbi:UDP-N-acetylglucosamine 2-epimerase [Vibrio rumoiensis 1S-45]|uniref:UDP-N-acetylglucosamine 2-epimerase (non-hydrolyzing) n=2 Tax=Vibrio rumoiensis TaxID=76258 RepID=A0A1E5E1S0_9VIBR|nr:UDP-N-acetylglucosamine 2-epimerase [Vibrio rumoiensis 1S-45]